MLYPIKFEPIYKEMVWGGSALRELFNRDIPSQNTGESWDVSCRKNEMSIIANGSFKGKTFNEYIDVSPQKILGKNIYKQKDFPLLVKIISAKDDLSVQVHPTDLYAQKTENYIYGKKEMWYILHSPSDGKLVAGLKTDVSKVDFINALQNGKTEDCLSYLPIKQGDVINISEGLVHAITKGVVLAEIQQNSDITYRVYDYDRKGLDGKPRELHIEKALDVIDFENNLKKDMVKGLNVKIDDNTLTYLISNPCFTIIKYDILKNIKEISNENKFYIFTCLDGNCTVKNDVETLNINVGDSFFIPATLGQYEIIGRCSLLKSFVGERETDFDIPLINAGYSLEDIKSL